jgi:ribosomal protein S27AE
VATLNKDDFNALRVELGSKMQAERDRCSVCGAVDNFSEGATDLRVNDMRMTKTVQALVRICRNCGHIAFYADSDSRA